MCATGVDLASDEVKLSQLVLVVRRYLADKYGDGFHSH
jgi:hypothetical protein